MKTEPTKPAPLHEYFEDRKTAEQIGFRTNRPIFHSWVEGKEYWSVRVKEAKG